MPEIPIFATYFTSPHLRRKWRDGNMACQWAAAYSSIFDSDDLRIARNQAHLGYHFHEWLSAILLYHTQGLLSLVNKYTFRSHARKRSVVEHLCDHASAQFLLNRGKEALTQCPDLLVYHSDLSDWFFCEVKGPHDYLRPKQVKLFGEVEQATGKKVYVVKLVDVGEPERVG